MGIEKIEAKQIRNAIQQQGANNERQLTSAKELNTRWRPGPRMEVGKNRLCQARDVASQRRRPCCLLCWVARLRNAQSMCQHALFANAGPPGMLTRLAFLLRMRDWLHKQITTQGNYLAPHFLCMPLENIRWNPQRGVASTPPPYLQICLEPPPPSERALDVSKR